MMKCNRIGTFLSTFDGEGGQQPPAPPAPAVVPAPAAPAPAAAPQPGAVIPAAALPEILSAMEGRQAAAAAALVAAKAAQAEVPKTTTPEPPNTRKEQLDILLSKVDALTSRAEAAELEAFRQRAINAAKANGLKLVDSLVFGKTPAEIDASIQVAVAEYELIAASVAKELKTHVEQQQQSQQQQQQQPVGTPGAPVEYPVGAPSNITASQPQQHVPDPNLLTMEQIRYLTTTGLRTGEYHQHRERIMAQLRGQMPHGPGNRWSFDPGWQIAPGLPQQQGYANVAGQQQPVFPTAPIHAAPGTQLPQQVPAQPTPGVMQQPMYQQQQAYQQYQGGPPQPQQLDQGGPLNVSQAQFAANNAIAQARLRAAVVPKT